MDNERDYRDSRKKYGKYSQKSSKGIFSKLLAFLLTLVIAGVIVQTYLMDMFPIMYLAIGGGVFALMALLIWFLAFRRSRVIRGISCILSLMLIAALGLSSYYLMTTEETIQTVTAPASQSTVTQTDEMVFLVLKDSPMQSLADLTGAKLGIQATMDRANTDKALAELQSKVEIAPETTEYNGLSDMIQALYDNEVEAVVYNKSYHDLVTDSFETFDDDTRILETVTYQTQVEVTQEAEKEVKKVDEDTFVIYLSGIDTYGEVSTRSRSDVNILAVVNPTSKQILLVSTPRDYYIELPFAPGSYDKLTHCGIYGVDCSIKTLENLYGIDVDYYLRMNFDGFMSIVDALDGVDVESDQAFTGEVYHVSFNQGINHVDGRAALSFVRERHSFKDGDYQRQRNQLAMIRAIVNKMASPAILTNFGDVMASISTSFTTDMSSSDISDLVKMQLADGGNWNIETYGVSGTGARKTTYSMGSRSLYVALQDPDSIAGAKAVIEKVKAGEILTDADSVTGNQE